MPDASVAELDKALIDAHDGIEVPIPKPLEPPPQASRPKLTPDEVRAALRGERRYIPERGRAQKVAFFRWYLGEAYGQFQDHQQRYLVGIRAGMTPDIEMQFLSTAAASLELIRVIQEEIQRLIEGIPPEAIAADAAKDGPPPCKDATEPNPTS